MSEPDCFLRYCISAAMQNFIMSGKSHVYTYWEGIGRLSLERLVVLKWLYSAQAIGTTLSEVDVL